MKRNYYYTILVAAIGWSLTASAQSQAVAQSQTLAAPDTIAAYPLQITTRYTTNILFPSAIFRVDLGTEDVLAKKMDKTENVLLLKANRKGMEPTNVSVYLADGKFYSFAVTYGDSLASYNYSFSAPASRAQYTGILTNTDHLDADAATIATLHARDHLSTSSGRVHLRLNGIFLKDNLLWLNLRARNASPIDFQPAVLHFSIRDRKRLRRTATQSIDLSPVYIPADSALSADHATSLIAALKPFTLSRDKQLVVEWREAGDGRRVRLTIRGHHLLHAKRIG